MSLSQNVLHSITCLHTCLMLCSARFTLSAVAADNVFRLLHISVAVLFSEQLQKDLASLKEGKPTDVSLAAKWAPTPGGMFCHSHARVSALD